MKTLKLFIAFFVVGLTILSACRKGNDDPLFSFRTRDARITNDWKLTQMERITTEVNIYNKIKNDKFYFDGTTMSEYHIDFFENVTEVSYPYSDSLAIKKDGTYEQTIKIDNISQTLSSQWFWVDSNKDKIAISFTDGKTYLIQKLTKDEIVFTQSYSTKDLDENGKETTTTFSEMLNYVPYESD